MPYGRCSIVHTTTRATPTQLVFGRDALLNIAFVADWHYIKEPKMRRIVQNNKCENATWREHTYQPGDQVMVKEDSSRKFGDPEPTFVGSPTAAAHLGLQKSRSSGRTRPFTRADLLRIPGRPG